MLSGITLVMVCMLLMMISSSVPIVSDRIPLIGEFRTQSVSSPLIDHQISNYPPILPLSVLFYSNSLAMVSLSMVFSVWVHNLAKSTKPDNKVPKYVSQLLNTKFGTVMSFTSLKVKIKIIKKKLYIITIIIIIIYFRTKTRIEFWTNRATAIRDVLK